MIQEFLYAGVSAVTDRGGQRAIRLAPNLSREPVAFDAELKNPLRFREAISALHDVVISDLKFKKKDKSAYEQWQKEQALREQAVRRNAYQQASADIKARQNQPIPLEFKQEFETARQQYWGARIAYSDYLKKHNPELWRQLVPCDPVITVAPDVVFFECFSKDESAYGCLYVTREQGFGSSSNLQLGTTNVDYSEDLYEQFQTLRTYQATRFNLDPEGVTVATEAVAEHREEKIDLPNTWLRGFMKLQAAMTMPTIRVRLEREVVYSLLAFLKRRKARSSPRALRFELEPGQPPKLFLEPWQQAFTASRIPYDGPATSPLRIWGTRRLLALARLLPLADSIEVHLLGTGLPSFWVVRMGEMSFVLGLSGWTTNDWSAGSALDLLQPPRAPSADLIARVADELKQRRCADLPAIASSVGESDLILVASALRHLAQSGQVIFDVSNAWFRYRQIMAQPLGEAQLGPEDPEVAGARKLIEEKRYELVDRQDGPKMSRVIIGKVESKPVEIMVDPDDRIKRGKCMCGHYQKYGLRNGPCRHMLALRWGASVGGLAAMRMPERKL